MTNRQSFIKIGDARPLLVINACNRRLYSLGRSEPMFYSFDGKPSLFSLSISISRFSARIILGTKLSSRIQISECAEARHQVSGHWRGCRIGVLWIQDEKWIINLERVTAKQPLSHKMSLASDKGHVYRGFSILNCWRRSLSKINTHTLRYVCLCVFRKVTYLPVTLAQFSG